MNKMCLNQLTTNTLAISFQLQKKRRGGKNKIVILHFLSL